MTGEGPHLNEKPMHRLKERALVAGIMAGIGYSCGLFAMYWKRQLRDDTRDPREVAFRTAVVAAVVSLILEFR